MSKRSCVGIFALLLISGGCGEGMPPVNPRRAPPPLQMVPMYTGPLPETPDDPAPPPPISGGTLLVSNDGTRAVLSDPDTDRVIIVEYVTGRVTAVALERDDEPGRLVEDGHRRVHVALRRGGAVVSIDLNAGVLLRRVPVCAAPRGIAWEASSDTLRVACQEGTLVTLPTTGSEGVTRSSVARDLRDVIVVGNRILMTRFRAAEVLFADTKGVVTRRTPLGAFAAVLRRMVPSRSGAYWLLHERSGPAPIGRAAGAPQYYETTAPCPDTEGITRPSLTLLRPGLAPSSLPDVPGAALAVDIAESRDGLSLALAVPGNAGSLQRAQVLTVPAGSPSCLTTVPIRVQGPGQVISVAYAQNGHLLAQTRAPTALLDLTSNTRVSLGGLTRDHDGHRLFHTNPNGTVACAMCHAEGDDDGRTWVFDGVTRRRTQHLRGGILGSEPLHWAGDLRDMRALVADVMVRGMRAPAPSDVQVASLARWIDALPRLPTTATRSEAASRGEALFQSTEVGCAGCHSGPRFSNNSTVDVGTGEALQTPTLLGLAARAPYMHNGCAQTLTERFDPECGGGDRHGHTSHLSPSQIQDLVAYLETL